MASTTIFALTIAAFVLCFGGVILEAEAHPTYYLPPHNASCDQGVDFQSYHIHVLFWQNNKNHTAGALQLRQKFIEAFRPGPACTNLFHQDRLCMFEPDMEPAGPFVVAQWAVYVLPPDFKRTVTWMMQNRGEFDILVHPNSGCEIEDHTTWALWGGQPWQIDLSAFGHDTPFPWGPNHQQDDSFPLRKN
ncbi:DOPA 4,5-dioxygenase [Balamuthia mandrillaris]